MIFRNVKSVFVSVFIWGIFWYDLIRLKWVGNLLSVLHVSQYKHCDQLLEAGSPYSARKNAKLLRLWFINHL